MSFKEKLHNFRFLGLGFTAFEVIMHAYLFVILITSDGITSGFLKTSAIGFTLFEVLMNLYLFVFLLIHKGEKNALHIPRQG